MTVLRTFQNYHRHSFYTNIRVSDSVVSNADYAKRAVELGHQLISSCEHAWAGRYIECYELAQQYNLKFIEAAEAYWVKDRFEKDRSNCHIFLAAKNENGRRALNDVLSEANITGFYGQARVDIPLLLSLPADDIWCTTACLMYWKYDDIDDITKMLRDHFQQNFFLEVQYHNDDKQRHINERILKLAKQEKIPLIMGCDSHYILPMDAQDRADYISSKGMDYPDESGFILDYPDGDTAYQRFANQGVLSGYEIDEAMQNTNVFLEVEDYDCPCFTQDIKMPTLYPDLSQDERDALYDKMIWSAWEKEKTHIPPEQHAHYEDEIRKEIEIVHTTKHADYFLLDHEIVLKGVENGGVLTSTGRGSAVSFYTNKLAGLTEVDRIAAKVKMYPERFMSPTRILESKVLADVDLNVSSREPFLLAQKQVMGEECSYEMIAYGTLKPKAAWKMYAKSQNVNFQVANDISAQIEKYEQALKHASEDEKESIDVLNYIEPQYRDIFQQSKKYQGIVSHITPHPCATLLYQGNIRKEIGLINVKGEICCVMDGKWAEEYKFLKNDWLKVSVVDLIDRVYKRIGIKRHTVDELLALCPPDSPVWDIYKKSCTLGINQVEQPGSSKRVALYAPTNISELCAFVAAIRPGFQSMYKIFEERKPFSYGIKALDDLIQTPEMPNSFVLYQESSMAVLNYAGIQMSECYEIIKNIAKKRVKKVLKYKEQFLSGFEEALVERERLNESEAVQVANQVWQILEDSSSYSFNCVSGNTVIKKTAENNVFTPTIDEMHRIKNDKKYAQETGHIDLYKKYKRQGYGTAFSMCSNGQIIENRIVDIYPMGVQEAFKITTKYGREIVCTEEHKFPTPDGEKLLKEIQIGSFLYSYDENEQCATLDEIISIDYAGEEFVYDVEMEDPNHNYVIDNGLITSNCSHSYCVAIDSLYGAYLKTYYPLQFYETFLRVLEEKCDKDRMNATKEEAENYFNIKFPPYRYGQDNRAITADIENRTITNSMSAIKGFGSEIGDVMYECYQAAPQTFIDVLKWLDNKSIKSSRVKPLINIDYFSSFGNIRELSTILSLFDFFKQGEAKTVKKTKVAGSQIEPILSQFATDKNAKGKELKSYTIKDMDGLLKACESYVKSLNLNDLDYKVKMANQLDILGYVELTTNKEEDRRKLLVTDIVPMKSKQNNEIWGYAVFTRSIGSGKNGRFTLRPAVYQKQPIKKMDIIYVGMKDIGKSKSGYWNLYRYDFVQ